VEQYNVASRLRRFNGVAILLLIVVATWGIALIGSARAAETETQTESGVAPPPVATAPTGVATATRTNTPLPGGTITPSPISTNTPPPGNTNTPVPTSTSTPGVPTPVPTGFPTVCPITFTDVSPTDWFYDAVRWIACGGFASGYSDNTFRPYNNTTRGQLSKIVVLANMWTPNTTGGPHFSDVPATNPFYPYIETAYHRGVISGYADGTFRWENDVTRGQLTKIVVLSRGWTINTGGGPHFSDVPATNPFYQYIETAYNRNVIAGYADGTFRWGNNATRAQLSKIIQSSIVNP
jgi:hypothetical protein